MRPVGVFCTLEIGFMMFIVGGDHVPTRVFCRVPILLAKEPLEFLTYHSRFSVFATIC